MTHEKRKWPWEVAAKVALAILDGMKPLCGDGYCTVAGSVRRKKPGVGDIEIVYVPLIGSNQLEGELFGTPMHLVDVWLNDMVKQGAMKKRLNALGRTTWGGRIKLATEAAYGIPVDFFEATKLNWHNYLVCRTGPKESNVAICQAALARGWAWHPYSPGFMRQGENPELHVVKSEAEVFEFVGLKHVPPELR